MYCLVCRSICSWIPDSRTYRNVVFSEVGPTATGNMYRLKNINILKNCALSWFIYKIMLMTGFFFFSEVLHRNFFIVCTFVTPVLQFICHRHVSLQYMKKMRLRIPLIGEGKAPLSTKHDLEWCGLTQYLRYAPFDTMVLRTIYRLKYRHFMMD